MAQYLTIDDNTTYSELCNRLGTDNANRVLVANGLKRGASIGQQYKTKVQQAVNSTPSVGWQSKVSILNTMTQDSDVFESAALSDDRTWKCLQTIGSYPNMLKLPDGVTVPPASDTLGGTGVKVSNQVYSKTMQSLQSGNHDVDPAIFSDYSSMAPSSSRITSSSNSGSNSIYNMFNLPWGKIVLYSSIDETTIDFPVYPEEISDGSKANYTTMPNMIYQYEPWYAYESSGPRSVTYNFNFHRDMWSGNHTDGKANELVRFCQACCYPEYNGSAVNAPIVTLYINGERHISGIMTSAEPKWSGPIGQDGFYLVCDLSISITEISPEPLSYSAMKSKTLIGG